MPRIIVLPENHPKRILLEVGAIRKVCENSDLRNPENVRDIEKYRKAEKKLFDYATDIIALESRILGCDDVSIIYSEMEDSTMLQLYGKWIQGKKLVYLDKGFYGAEDLKAKNETGRLDPIYELLQKQRVDYWIDRMTEEPPEEGTFGVLKTGGHHTEGSVDLGKVVEALRDKGVEAKAVQFPNYQSLIDKCLEEAGLDVNRIRASAMV
jgi:hypothetical protein